MTKKHGDKFECAPAKEPLASRVLRVSLYIVFGVGVLATAALPVFLDFYFRLFFDAYAVSSSYRSFILVFLIASAIPVLWIVLEMIMMLRTIPKGPFTSRNARALGRIGYISLGLAALFFLKCFLYMTFLTLACGALFLIAGLFAFTLASLFGQALAFKEENDLTI